MFVARDRAALSSRDWLTGQLGRGGRGGQTPAVLAGRAPGVQVERGAIVCACFHVGLRTIARAIVDQRLADAAAIGQALGAGTNCGSCRAALARILADARETELAHAS